jgi:hypothetical protein
MSHNLRILSQRLFMIEQLTLLLATPIAKAILDKFYEGIGSKLGERAVELLPDKVKQLGQLVWESLLWGKPNVEVLLQNAVNGTADDQKKLAEYVYERLDTDADLKQEAKTLAAEIHQEIQIGDVKARNVLQVFGGQGLQVNEAQAQPIIQIQGNPTLHFGKSD